MSPACPPSPSRSRTRTLPSRARIRRRTAPPPRLAWRGKRAICASICSSRCEPRPRRRPGSSLRGSPPRRHTARTSKPGTREGHAGHQRAAGRFPGASTAPSGVRAGRRPRGRRNPGRRAPRARLDDSFFFPRSQVAFGNEGKTGNLSGFRGAPVDPVDSVEGNLAAGNPPRARYRSRFLHRLYPTYPPPFLTPGFRPGE